MSEYDVVVIGAGAAGIAATRALVEADRSVVCLEAMDRIGGRAHTDTEIFGVPYDIGAHWLHCEHVNALKGPGLRLGFDLYAAPDHSLTAGLEDEALLWDAVDGNFERAEQALQAIDRNEDLSFADVMTAEGPWALTTQAMCCLSVGRDPAQISVRDMNNWEGGDDWLCREGFGALMACLADGLPICVSSPVSEIQARSDHVKVVTSKGLLTAHSVIVTVSVGVLAEEMIRFDPPLDADRREALNQITMSDYHHTALLFHPGAVPVQPDTWLTYKIDEAVDSIPQGGGFLCNASGTGLTSFETGGSFSRSLQEASAEDAIDHALETLVGIFGTELRRQFLKGHTVSWRKEPFIRGSYSGAMPGGFSQREVLRQPHTERVQFAGEATHATQAASVSGAYMEGLRCSNKVLELLLKKRD